MLKVKLLSDIHTEFHKKKLWVPSFHGEDVLVLAGDIQCGLTKDAWFTDLLEHRDVIYICGNHESYHYDLLDVQYVSFPLWAARINETAEARGFTHKLYALQNQTIEIGDVRFIATTLWTDFNKNDNLIKIMAARSMNDYNYITYGDKRLGPEDIYGEHTRGLSFIEQELAKETDKKTFLVTHHSLSYQSVHTMYRTPRDTNFNYLYYSDLERILEQCDIAVHGHTHNSFDYSVGKCRVVCNPYGYHGYELNPNFKEDLIIEI